MNVILRNSQPLLRRISNGRSNLQQSRSFAADAHGEVKVNCWEAPLDIPKWKEEHIVLTVLATWGIVIYSSLKIFGGKKEVTAPTEGAAQTAPAH